MAKTYTAAAALDNVTPVTVTVQSTCYTVELGENAGAATADWKWRGSADDPYVTIPAGSKKTFIRVGGKPFDVGEVIGEILLTAAGPAVFMQEEY